ncbi:MAG: hypothetical protein RBU29_10110, partial [bacterium]|nr:hypothetical protein [bacterium]
VWAGRVLVGVYCKKRWMGIADGLLWGAVGVLLLASVFNRVNIGVRHILPVYPLLHLYLGRVVLLEARWVKGLVGVLGVWYLAASLQIYPHCLSYFNELAGGPERGHLWLDDSNLDWGQDLNLLRDLQGRYPGEPLFVATSWMFVPEAFGVQAERLGPDQIANPPQGLVAVSKHWAIRSRVNRHSPAYFDWIETRTPLETLGHSIWIYRFPRDEE